MTEYFRDNGRSLLANGYLIIPITPGEKRPAIGGWQNSRLGAADLDSHPGHGVGILTGQGAHPIVGIDIDVSDAQVCASMVEWCRANLGIGCERVGAAPRVLLTYRAAESGWAKGNSTAFFDPSDPVKPNGKKNEQRIEVLGLGQQFVAYAVHPDIGRPYEWTDLFGGVEHVRADELPVVTLGQIDALFAELDRQVRAAGRFEILYAGDAPSVGSSGEDGMLLALVPPCGLTPEQAVEALGYIDNAGGVDYDTWVRVGMALHHESGGAPWGLDAWLAWSRRSAKHVDGVAEKKWRSFDKTGRNPTTFRWVLKIAAQSKSDAEVQVKRATLAEMKARIAQADDEFALTGRIAAEVRAKMPNDAAVRGQVLAAFQARFQEITGTRLQVADVKKMLIERATPTVKQQRPLTEFGNAERMLDRFGDGLMFVPETSEWYIWTGIYWRGASNVEIEHFAKETVRGLASEIDEHADPAEFYAFCAASQQARMVRNMVALIASDPRVVVPIHALDADPWLLGVRNGVVDLRTGALLPPDPRYRITHVAGANYVPTAKAPLFEQTVNDVFSGDAELVKFFGIAIGYALMGQPEEDVLFIPFGNGANGKSTLFGTVRRAFGDYAKSADASSFIAESRAGGGAGGAREDLLRLKGSRFVYVNEPDENGELREGTVKSMTGGDAISARGLYAKHSVEIVPTWTVFMPTNHKPIVKGSDHGIWRRLVAIPFERNFDSDPNLVKDPDREKKLHAEMEGVLAWAVQNAIRYQKEGLIQPAGVRAAREQYKQQMDLLSEWIEECCDLGPHLFIESNALWLSWEQFARTRGILNYVKSSVALGRRLDSRFPTFRDMNTRYRRGITLKQRNLQDFADLFA